MAELLPGGGCRILQLHASLTCCIFTALLTIAFKSDQTIFTSVCVCVRCSVYVLDSNNGQSVVRSIPVIVCSGCNGHGDCDFTKVQKSTGGLYFQHAVCVCFDGKNCSD